MIDEKYTSYISMMSKLEVIQRTGLQILELRDKYTKLVMPIDINKNHVGIMYAGSLFSLGEVIGGIMWGVMFDKENFYPVVKEVNIRFKRPAMTDVSLEKEFSEEEASQIQKIAEKEGKADYELELELKDTNGEVVAIANGTWQIRKMSDDLKEMMKALGI